MKKILIATVLAVFSATSMAKDLAIAYVNGQAIFQEFRAGIDKKLDAEFRDRKQNILSLQEKIQQDMDKLKKEADILSSTEARTLNRDLEVKQRDYQSLSKAYQEDFNLRGNEELKVLGEKVQKVIDEVAKSRNFEIVFQSAAMVYVDEKYDITGDVMKKLKAHI